MGHRACAGRIDDERGQTLSDCARWRSPEVGKGRIPAGAQSVSWCHFRER